MRITDIKIGMRLSLTFGALMVMMIAMVVISIVRFTEAEAMTTRSIEDDWAKSEAAAAIDAMQRANAQRVMETVLYTDPAKIQHSKALLAENRKAIEDAMAVLDDKVHSPEGLAILDELKRLRVPYVNAYNRTADLADTGRREEALEALSTATLPALDALREPMVKLNSYQKRMAEESGHQALRDLHNARLLVLALGIAAIVLGCVMAYVITLSITRPLASAVQLAETVAAGDLTAQLRVTGRDEISTLQQSLSHMVGNLQNIVGDVRRGSESIATATQQIAMGNTDLSSRTEEQAAALEQTAASMQELSGTVSQNYEHGKRASDIAEQASQVAVRGGEVVARMVTTMEAINQSSRQIADIIGVIDGIAFQTNILALNAAVEAARAGEQGRGFAVVAGEVRRLAQRAAESAKEIKTLIETSVGNVTQGVQQVEQTGSTMDEIVVNVRRVADIMGEIAMASQDQSQGIDQINQAVGQMDQVTQANAALVEEAAAAAQALEGQAQGLLRTIQVFKLNDSPSAASSNSAPTLGWRG